VSPRLSSSTPQRATLFDEVASTYHDVRPGYPDTVFEQVIRTTAVPSGARILEIGCGTGKATVPFASRGFQMLCLEPGPNLAAVARMRLKDFPLVQVLNTTLEQWLVEPNAFDLVVSAQAFHWVDPAIRLPKAASALRRSGHIALIWNVPLVSGSPLAGDLERVYRTHAPDLIKMTPTAIIELEAEINAAALFDALHVSRSSWSATYDSAHYLALLDTYSDHRLLPEATRNALFTAVGSVIDRAGGTMTVPYETVLFIAQVRPLNTGSLGGP